MNPSCFSKLTSGYSLGWPWKQPSHIFLRRVEGEGGVQHLESSERSENVSFPRSSTKSASARVGWESSIVTVALAVSEDRELPLKKSYFDFLNNRFTLQRLKS